MWSRIEISGGLLRTRLWSPLVSINVGNLSTSGGPISV